MIESGVVAMRKAEDVTDLVQSDLEQVNAALVQVGAIRHGGEASVALVLVNMDLLAGRRRRFRLVGVRNDSAWAVKRFGAVEMNICTGRKEKKGEMLHIFIKIPNADCKNISKSIDTLLKTSSHVNLQRTPA